MRGGQCKIQFTEDIVPWFSIGPQLGFLSWLDRVSGATLFGTGKPGILTMSSDSAALTSAPAAMSSGMAETLAWAAAWRAVEPFCEFG